MRFWLITLTLLVINVGISAQSADDSSEPVNLKITSENRASIDYTVDTDPEYVTIQVRAIDNDVIDPVLWVLNSENNLIAYNDNTAEDSSAKVENLLLHPDTYTIWIDSFNGVSEGDVELIIEPVNPFNEAISTSENTIELVVTLPEDTIYRYTLELTENDIVTISIRDISGTLDPYLQVLDDNDMMLISNDDHQSTDLTLNRLDSRISQWQVPENGIYTIEIRDFLGNHGQFELTITSVPN